MIKTSVFFAPFLLFSLITSVHDFQSAFPNPVSITNVAQVTPDKKPLLEHTQITRTRMALKLLDAPEEKIEKLTIACYTASINTGLDPVLIATIIPKESGWKIDAKSKKGYKGLMQTKQAEGKWSRAEVDILRGSCILQEKLIESKGNLLKAMSKYKGAGGKESQRLAKDQLKFYNQIKNQVDQALLEKEKSNNA